MTSLPPNSERYDRGMQPRDEPLCPKHVGGMTVQQSQAFRALPIRGALGHGAAGVVHLLLILSAAWTYAHGWRVAMLVLWCAIAWMDHAGAVPVSHDEVMVRDTRDRADQRLVGMVHRDASCAGVARGLDADGAQVH